MISLIMATVLATGLGHAGDWKKHAPEPRLMTDFTAYTVPKKTWRLGLFSTRYGLLDNTQIGINNVLLPLGAANIQGKITAIQMKRIDLSFQGQYIVYSLQPLLKIDGTVSATPIGWTGSWQISPKTSLHLGNDWLMGRIDAQLTADQFGQALSTMLGGADLGPALSDLGTGAAAGANFTIAKSRLAFDWRLNRRDSIIIQSQNYLVLNGVILGGATNSNGEEGGSTTVGGGARINQPLDQSVGGALTVSWQWSWKRYHLRLGIPISGSTSAVLASVPAAFQMYWLLGKLPPPSPAIDKPKKTKKGRK